MWSDVWKGWVGMLKLGLARDIMGCFAEFLYSCYLFLVRLMRAGMFVCLVWRG